MQSEQHYTGLDGLRMIAAFGIIAVHVAKNTGYTFDSYFYTNIICRFESFVNLFFLISGFSMSCGYYERIKSGELSINDFYIKRYRKIWPFFALLVCVDMLYSWKGISTLAEAFTDLTLTFAFLPGSNIEVIGVGWTLGVIFAFYILFPFFVFLMWTRKRAWFAFCIAMIYNMLKDYLFSKGSSYELCNILVWSCYFIAGGIIYLYKDEIVSFIKKRRWICLSVAVVSLFVWFLTPNKIEGVDISTLKTLFCVTVWVMYAISVDSVCLSNRVTAFVSEISFEIYLLHMFIYRGAQKIGVVAIFGRDNVCSYIIAFALVTIGTIVTAAFLKKIMKRIM